MTNPNQLPAAMQPSATPYPTDLDDAVAKLIDTERERAEKMLAGDDGDVAAVKETARPTIDKLIAERDEKVAEIRNAAMEPGPTGAEDLELTWGRLRGAEDSSHPLHDEWAKLQARIRERGSLTPGGAQLRIAKVNEDFTRSMDEAFEPLRTKLDDAEKRYKEIAEPAQPDDAHLREANEMVAQLRNLTPEHGLPILAYTIRDAAKDPTRLPFLRGVLPYVKSLYSAPGTPYERNVDLWTLLGKAEAVLNADHKRAFAERRLETVAGVRYQLNELARAAVDGGAALTAIDVATGKLTILPTPDGNE